MPTACAVPRKSLARLTTSWSSCAPEVTAAINAAADNPLVFARLADEGEGRALSGGNFHGEGLALWLDYLGIAMAEVASLAERRTFRLLTPELSDGLPSMLVPTSGLDSGLMMPQYTAAALVSENKTLAHPDSVDSHSHQRQSGGPRQHGGQCGIARAHDFENVRIVLAIEFLTAAQAVDLRPHGPTPSGRGRGLPTGRCARRRPCSYTTGPCRPI